MQCSTAILFEWQAAKGNTVLCGWYRLYGCFRAVRFIDPSSPGSGSQHARVEHHAEHLRFWVGGQEEVEWGRWNGDEEVADAMKPSACGFGSSQEKRRTPISAS